MRKWEEAPLPWIPSAPFALDPSPLPLPSCFCPPLTHLGLFSIWAAPLACSEVVPQDYALRTPLHPLSQAYVALWTKHHRLPPLGRRGSCLESRPQQEEECGKKHRKEQ